MLGVEPGASPDDIKAAWRALARQHHPDLIGDDPESAQRATRRMAEINAAYAALTRAGETIEGRRRGANGSGSANGTATPPRPATGTERRGGPPPDEAHPADHRLASTSAARSGRATRRRRRPGPGCR